MQLVPSIILTIVSIITPIIVLTLISVTVPTALAVIELMIIISTITPNSKGKIVLFLEFDS